jgi:4'-phosphopantetheinyl transferase
MSLNGSQIYVSYLHTGAMDHQAVRAAEASLSAQELNRRNQFRLADDRRDYTVAHDLLRRTLSRFGSMRPNEWNFAVGPQGKPSIAPPSNSVGLSFSLSHTRGLVACAVTVGKELGLDVERIDRDLEIDDIAERFFSSDEVKALRRYRGEAKKVAFIELWTLKEAVVKGTGRGLSQPLSTFSIDLDHDSPNLVNCSAGDNALFWQFALFAPSPSTRMAVAVCSAPADDIRFDARAEDGTSLRPIRQVSAATLTS